MTVASTKGCRCAACFLNTSLKVASLSKRGEHPLGVDAQVFAFLLCGGRPVTVVLAMPATFTILYGETPRA